jgi:tetratricopeptide (TPR) repeat protein
MVSIINTLQIRKLRLKLWGQAGMSRGDYDTALRYLEQSLKISEQIGDIAGEAITCFNMARIFAQTGKIEKAIPLVERTVEIDRLTQNPDLENDLRYLMELKEKSRELS